MKNTVVVMKMNLRSNENSNIEILFKRLQVLEKYYIVTINRSVNLATVKDPIWNVCQNKAICTRSHWRAHHVEYITPTCTCTIHVGIVGQSLDSNAFHIPTLTLDPILHTVAQPTCSVLHYTVIR